MTAPALLSPERLVVASAKGLTRRRMFRNVGSLGLGAGMATVYFGRTEAAEAQCSTDPAGACHGAPICGSFRCDSGDQGQCDVHESGTDKSSYGTAECREADGSYNCWCEGSTACCDCCAYQPSCTAGAVCAHNGNCSGAVYMCICRSSDTAIC